MPFGGFGPRLWHPVLPEQDVVDSCTDLVRTGVWPNFSDACSQSRHGDRLYSVGNLISRKCTGRESTMRYQDKDCPRGQIGIYRFSEVHRNTHCRRCNEERDLVVTGLDDVRVSYNELPLMIQTTHLFLPGLLLTGFLLTGRGHCVLGVAIHRLDELGPAKSNGRPILVNRDHPDGFKAGFAERAPTAVTVEF